jgi:tRNA-modifying protein YgfZ
LTAYYAKLEREALLHICGPDSLTFLQGQTTCDTRTVDNEHTVPGAFCTPQGRMVCDFLLGQIGVDQFALRLRADTLEAAATTFGKYIVFSKAELDASRKDWQVVACWGDSVADAFRELKLPIPGSRHETTTADGLILIQMDEAGQQFEAWLDMEQHADHYQALEQAMTAASESDWEALRIRSGDGRVEGATLEEFLPQMLNYDITGHVSFNKGCYTGQEIVARLHYRGKAKRRLYLASGGTEALAAGTSLFPGGSDKSIGTVVNSTSTSGEAVHLVSSTEDGLSAPLHPGASDNPVQLTLEPVHDLSGDDD